MKQEGFWVSEEEPELPSPVVNKTPWEGINTFLPCLREVEDRMMAEYGAYVSRRNDGEKAENNSGVEEYRGSSRCRVCGCSNGHREFRRGGWAWPEGLRHYIAEHFVQPSDEFIMFIIALRNGSRK